MCGTGCNLSPSLQRGRSHFSASSTRYEIVIKRESGGIRSNVTECDNRHSAGNEENLEILAMQETTNIDHLKHKELCLRSRQSQWS